jgi:carboxypeptidase C (cathepsin A)
VAVEKGVQVRKLWIAGIAVMLVALAAGATAQQKPPEAPAKPAEKPAEKPDEKTPPDRSSKEPPAPEQSVTQHTVTIGGVLVAYTATAGTLIVRNEKDEPWASIGYVAYVRKGGASARQPISFAYNGGPGSSSIWLHMGALGPRRVVTSDAAPTGPPPYRVVDNAYSLLDKTDLVLIDPVGTGVSRAVGEAKDKDFWSVDADIESVSRFIKQYVTDNARWNSPKYLIGESYGTTRSAGVVDYLQTRAGMAFNGVVLVSVALDLGAIFAVPGNDRPYPFFLPSFAATAWYHKLLPNPPQELEPWLTEVRRFAAGEYALALAEGDRLSAERRAEIIKKLQAYTGLSEQYLDLADLRVNENQFTQELLRPRRITVARLDSRFSGITFDPLAKEAEEDPQAAAITAAFTAALLDWYHEGLKFGRGKTYVVTADVWRIWDFRHKTPGAPIALPSLTNTGVDLAHAMAFNPNLRVLLLNGLYDLATPFFATESMVAQLHLAKPLQSHAEMKYYPAGHMMYAHEPSLKTFKADVADFIGRTSQQQ